MRRKLWIALAIILVNLCLLEAGTRLIAVHAKPTLGKTAVYDRKFQLAGEKHADVPEMLMLGDSLMYYALYPELLDVLLSRHLSAPVNSLNLASPSTTPEMNLLLLKQVVAKSGKPRLVLYNFSPRVFNGNKPQDEYDVAFHQSYYNRCFEGRKQNWAGSVRCFMEKHLAFARYREFLKSEMEKIPRTIFQFKERMEYSSDNTPELEVSDKGWAPSYQINRPGEMKSEYADNNKIESIFQDELGHYRWSTDAMQPFLAYCREQGIPVLIIWFPEHDLMARYYRQIGLSESGLAARLQSMANNRSVYFLNMRNHDLQDIQFSDLDHVNALGTLEITKAVAQLLLKPPYRGLLLSKGEPP